MPCLLLCIGTVDALGIGKLSYERFHAAYLSQHVWVSHVVRSWSHEIASPGYISAKLELVS